MEKIKCSEKVTNEQVLERAGEKRTLLNNILRRKGKWIGHILRRNWLGVMFAVLHYMAQRPGHKRNWSGSIWTALKMAIESN